LLDAARDGRGSLALIGGEVGIGKTALAEALCSDAAAGGAQVLVGHCYDLAETPPYGPWVEAFARAPRDDGLPALPAAVLPPEHDGEALASQGAIARRTLAYLAALGKTHPLVLLVEDLHWADAASLDLLRALARSLAGVPLLLLATYRADEVAPDHPLHALLPALVREARAARLDLRPLDAAAIGALVATRYALGVADRDRLAAYLARRTEGNALFVGEVLRTLEGSGVLRETGAGWTLGELAGVPVPPLLRQVIAGRLARLGDEDRRLLAVAAVLGQEPPFALWATVGDAGEEALLATAERAVAAHALEATASGVRFAHALIREALYAGVLAPRRRAWHRRAGEALLATPGPDPDVVAHHLRQAGDQRAAAWLVRAGERAQRAYAWLTAAERFAAALALLEEQGADAGRRIALLITLAQLRRYGDARESIALLEEAARLADTVGDAAQAASARFEAGHVRCIGWADPAGLAAMAAALPALEALSPDERTRLPALRILGIAPDERYHRGALVQWAAELGRYGDAWDLATPFRAHEPGTTGRGLAGLARVHAMRGRPEEARRALVASRAIFRAAGQHLQVAGSFKGELLYVALPYEADRVAARRRLAAEIEAAQARASDVAADIPSRGFVLELLVLEGAWDEARAVASAGLTSIAATARLESATVLARVALAQGEDAPVWAAVRELFPAGPATAPGTTYFPAALATFPLAVALALEAGDLRTAHDWLASQDRWLARAEVVLGLAQAQLGWAAYHRATGDTVRARRHAEMALAHATAPRQPLPLLAAHRTLGELASDAGHHADAADHLGRALALADACAAPYERALTLLALVDLRAGGAGTPEERAGAARLLAEARGVFDALGAAPARARADALAARLAVPSTPAPMPATFPAGLSAREVEVLRLIAAGRANHEIAAQLSISPNTVLRHVSHILAKTGAENRAAAAVFALRHGLDTPDAARP
jgi:DNA-binding CsgD family transcriptional regulator